MDKELINRLAREVFWQPRHTLEFPSIVAINRDVDPALCAFAVLIAEECAKVAEAKSDEWASKAREGTQIERVADLTAVHSAYFVAVAIRSKFSKG